MYIYTFLCANIFDRSREIARHSMSIDRKTQKEKLRAGEKSLIDTAHCVHVTVYYCKCQYTSTAIALFVIVIARIFFPAPIAVYPVR